MNKTFLRATFIRRFTSTSNSKVRHKSTTTAGIIVIGEEILKGDVLDTNSTFARQQLRKLGIKVEKISIVGDSIEDIGRDVRDFSARYNFVVTTGGIGPTHDDVTFEAVARAFDKPLVCNSDLLRLCQQFYRTSDPNYPGMKLAYIPESAVLNYVDTTKPGPDNKRYYPNISIRNVYMFPGIPELFLKLFGALSSQLFGTHEKFFVKSVFVNVTEDVIVATLNTLVGEYPDCTFGSYPYLFHDLYKVKVTIESTDETLTIEAYNKLIQSIPEEFVVDVNS